MSTLTHFLPLRGALTIAFLWTFGVDLATAREAQNKRATSPDASELTFTSLTPITINDNTTASPYPSNIIVNNPAITTVTRVKVALFNFRHTFPDDVDIVLVGPQGRRAVLMSDAGGGEDVNAPGIILTFSSSAAAALPDAPPTALTTGTYRPANYETNPDIFPAPGPGTLTNADASTDLSVFNLTDPNGTWSLYVVDDAGTDVGAIEQGWDLILTVPTVFTVTKTADTNDGVCDADCSLREAITAAQNDDLINFSTLFNTPQTINLLTALPDIGNSITIQGPGAHLLIVRRDYNAATDFRIFNIPGGAANAVAISGMTITGGRATGMVGGGINSLSNLRLTDVHVTGNTANAGGGVCLEADGVFTGCTFSANTGGGRGGGILYRGNGGRTLRVVNSTFSGNMAGDGGAIDNSSFIGDSRLEIVSTTIAGNTVNAGTAGGIHTFGVNAGNSATTTLRNSIIAGNTPNNLATATSGGGTATFQTLGFNLSDNFNGVFTPLGNDITAPPRLGPLSLGGGTTPTHALLGSSPALDAGDASGLAIDQRRVPRGTNTPGIPDVSDGSDIGAVEMQSLIVSNVDDSGEGSLRQAISDATTNGAGLDDIIFSNAVFNTTQTITLTTGEIVINSNVTLNGPGANLLYVLRDQAAADFRLFDIAFGLTEGVAFSGMTVGRGSAGSASFGGGINSLSRLTLTNVDVAFNSAGAGGGVGLALADGVFTGCTFRSNTADDGGAIFFLGNGSRALRLINSTVTSNQSLNLGGGISHVSNSGGVSNSRLEITNSTIANNTASSAPDSGGGIRTNSQNGAVNSATTTLRNTIVAGNAPTNLVALSSGGGPATVQTLGFNLANDNGGGFLNVAPITTDKINANAGLAQLAYNGASVPTLSLVSGSEAVDAGNNSGSGTLTDQRGLGFLRTVDLAVANAAGSDGTDIGAFEAQTDPPPAFLLTAGVSRLTHGSAGPFDINLPLSGNPGVEGRQGNGNHTLVFTFTNNIAGGSVTLQSGTISSSVPSISGNTLTLTLTGVANAQTLHYSFDLIDNFGQTVSVPVSIGFLVGDTTGNGTVTASDVGQTKSQSGQAVTSANFRSDVTANGGNINASDVGLVKSRSGTSLP